VIAQVNRGPITHPFVLVVDDHPMMRDLTRRAFEARGCETYVAEDGVEALILLADQPFDLVLSDISMPRLEGPALAWRLRAELGGPTIVLMSADPDADPRIPGVGFVTKPLGPDDLNRLVEQTRFTRLPGPVLHEVIELPTR
jgi:CheY-like chemotaxis protein